MKNLSHMLVAVIVTSIAFSSCKKSSTPSPATGPVVSSMKLTANGTDLSFNDCEELEVDLNSKHTTITGYINTSTGLSNVNFGVDIIHDPATLKAGQTYQAPSSFGQADGATFFYWPVGTDEFTSQPGNPQGSVTITAVTSTTISGTFSAKLFAQADFSGTTVLYTITNGSFTAKINK